MRTVRTRLICGLPLVALALTACGGSPTPAVDTADTGSGAGEAEAVYVEYAELTGQERRDRLVACAEEEGQLDWYTSLSAGPADAVVEAFSDAFDVDVSLYRASSEAVLQRIVQERDANYRGNDVVENNAKEMAALNAEGVFAEYVGGRRDVVPEVGRYPGWTATRFNVFTPAWNNELIAKVGPPTSWEELADPKYDGLLSMEVGDFDWYLALYSYWQEQGKSEAEIDKLFADMAQGSQIAKGHSVQVELLSAGQYGVLASAYTNTVDRAKETGAPVDYRPAVEPLIARANGVGLMKTATHPCAALLFTDWILEEGQAVLAEKRYVPSVPQGEDPLKGIELLAVDIDRLLNENEKWSKKYEAVVAGGDQSK